ncbi:HlyD family efflux transporter periplasmic adaptor subunit [Pelomonas sp. SE-A7]|uniref:HlyD family secretion protein n=1 Tax=Pelomonas sp. SE-A7 TaxID=3054953 RepID=UPI00259CAB1A|nr:HlyD family efflux transporter periplasmic adaptor subunit [Pelomonas sp. SE-A7]MDM4768470.1 HlyD family efflux transporter periplasmic adaptor subunit [Pelomonas sp. SE-A7]
MLFRTEALSALDHQWLGSAQVPQFLHLRALTALAVGAVFLVGTFLSLGEYTRKARVGGHLVPLGGVQPLSSPQAALVLQRLVEEGQSVKAGDPLFVLSLDSASEGSGEGVARSLAERQRSLADTAQQQRLLAQRQREDVELRALALQREIEQLRQAEKLQAERLALARQTLARHEALEKEQFVAAAQVQNKREEVLGLQVQQQDLQRQREGLQRELLSLQARGRELPLEAASRQGQLERQRAELQALGLETAARRRLVLRAPADGVLSTVQAEPGQPVAAGARLATVLPGQAMMLAHLYAPSSAIGFVHPQQQVQLRYQAFPYQKFGHQQGRVLQVARTPLSSQELSQLSLPAGAGVANEPLYRVTVALDRQSVQAFGKEQALTAGMQLDADVLLEKRKLIEWIFEPLLALGRRV